MLMLWLTTTADLAVVDCNPIADLAVVDWQGEHLKPWPVLSC